MEQFTLHFDGSCGPKNPGGTAGYGFVLSSQGATVESGHGVIGTGEGMTNNLAEFWALWQGLHAATRVILSTLRPRGTHLTVLGDSMLVIKMMNRQYRAKPDKAYYVAYDRAMAQLQELRALGVLVSFDWTPRETNQECDNLSKAHNIHLDNLSTS